MHFEVGLYQKLFVITIVALSNFPTSTLVRGPFILDLQKLMSSSGRQILASPEFTSNRKKCAMSFGAGNPWVHRISAPDHLSAPSW